MQTALDLGNLCITLARLRWCGLCKGFLGGSPPVRVQISEQRGRGYGAAKKVALE